MNPDLIWEQALLEASRLQREAWHHTRFQIGGSMKYKRLYELLKRQGHTACKAAEIILDARRGNEWALGWVRIIFRSRPRPVPKRFVGELGHDT